MTIKDTEYIIEIGGRFPTLNEYIRRERGNRYAAAKVKRDYTDLVAWQVKKHKGAITGKADFTFYWYTTTKADPDNIAFGKKFILDGLQAAGVIVNDNQKYVGRLSDVVVPAKRDAVVVAVDQWDGGVLELD